MLENWDAAFKTLTSSAIEGGFVDDPADPGGATNHGVTLAAWQAYVGHAVTVDDMRSLTVAQVQPLYKERYWDVVQGDSLPSGVDYAVFDCSVNSGPSRAIKLLQGCVGALQDGVLGPVTLDRVNGESAAHLIIDYCNARLAFMKGLPDWASFGKGWMARVAFVQRFCLQLAAAASLGSATPADPPPETTA